MNEPSDGLGDLNPRQLREMVRRYKTRAANSEAALAAAEQKVADAEWCFFDATLSYQKSLSRVTFWRDRVTFWRDIRAAREEGQR